MAADDGALDCSGESGIDPVAGEEESRDRCLHRRPGRLARGNRERRALLANDNGAAEHGAARGRHCGGQLAHREVHQLLVALPTNALAPLDTSERCELASPRIARLSNTHCIARPGSPTKE